MSGAVRDPGAGPDRPPPSMPGRLRSLRGDHRHAARQRADQQHQESNLSFFNTFLLVFALVALFVGAFIIYNTFSITVAQRTQELGLLRALGASDRQVIGSVAAGGAGRRRSSRPSSASGSASCSCYPAAGADQRLRRPAAEWVPPDRDPHDHRGDRRRAPLVTRISSLAPARRAPGCHRSRPSETKAVTPTSGRRRYYWGARVLRLVGSRSSFARPGVHRQRARPGHVGVAAAWSSSASRC